MAEVPGLLSYITSEVAAFNKAPEGTWLMAMDPGTYWMRETAIANRLLRPTVDAGKKSILWFEGNTTATSGVLATQISSNATTEFDFGTTYIKGVVPNQIWAFKDELVLVVSVDQAAGTCEVTRGFASTTPESTILVTDVGKVNGTVPGPVAVAGDPRAAFSTPYTNYMHYQEKVSMFDDVTQGTLSSYLTPDVDIRTQINDHVAEMGREFANALWDSKASAVGAVNRTMNGFRAQIPAGNITSSVGALLFADLDDATAASLALGGVLDTMVVSPELKVALAPWNRIRGGTYPGGDPSRAGGALNSFETASGPVLQVVPDSTMRAQEIFLCRAQDLHAGLVEFLQPRADIPGATVPAGIRAEVMARSGPFDKVQILSYASCQLTRPPLARLLTGVSSVDPDGKA